jgi:hypothetical protein
MPRQPFGMDRLGRVDADEPNTFAGTEHQRVSVYDSLNIFKLNGYYAWVGWIKESGEQRDQNEARQRPFPVKPARNTRIHGDAFSTSAVKASRQTCGKIRFSLALVCVISVAVKAQRS